MSHDDGISNPSKNRPFNDVLEVYSSRRKFMAGGLTLAAGSFFGTSLAFAAKGGQPGPNDNYGQKRSVNFDINFTPVAVADGTGPMPSISEDYEYQTLIPWGTSLDTITADYEGDPVFRPTAAEQAMQIGIGHDGMWFFPGNEGTSNDRGLLAINHEFGRNTHVLPETYLVQVDRGDRDDDDGSVEFATLPADLEAVQRSQHAHGVSVAEIYLDDSDGKWKLDKDSAKNRRIHVNTPVTFSGPVVDQQPALLDSGNPMLGTVNNCSNGYTPWGTYLTCEENFNGYFGDGSAMLDEETLAYAGDWVATAEQARYGFSTRGFDYGWEQHDLRFDLSQAGSLEETNRFGWVVEIDPANPLAPPVKRTAMGRFKHEGVALTVGQGNRAVAYMGDDQRFDYIYKFVSNYDWMSYEGMSPLDDGVLYVARFNDDGTGDWLELSTNNGLLAGWTQAEILTYARLAADAVGATPMDRPEWTSVAPNGDVYCTLTNNSRRTEADAANPLAPNSDGHIIRWHDADNHVGTTFIWDIFVFAEDTHGKNDERTFSDPDGIWIDPDGRLFIQTDGGQKKGLNNQMLVASTYDKAGKGGMQIKRLFTGVTSDEITGIAVTPDQRTMFINTQHPGNGDPSRTNFPASPDGVTIPRDCTIVITRKDGGIIGS